MTSRSLVSASFGIFLRMRDAALVKGLRALRRAWDPEWRPRVKPGVLMTTFCVIRMMSAFKSDRKSKCPYPGALGKAGGARGDGGRR
ncbi:hypothetical protein EVAR_32822_1 [Eumeta japonica]|uniref:Uncharacterized protein n=1 Tax=Eumeta variegata TaxID=151549 RepID=A0A4C1WBI2_EUMVA|nr:hypothetical protein EVAR_32822_1 [Eumeta japonica]